VLRSRQRWTPSVMGRIVRTAGHEGVAGEAFRWHDDGAEGRGSKEVNPAHVRTVGGWVCAFGGQGPVGAASRRWRLASTVPLTGRTWTRPSSAMSMT